MTGPRAVRRLLTTAGVISLAAGLAACGGGGPLGGALSKPQRHQLDAVWTARITATDGADIPPAERNQRVKDLYAACQQMAPGQPLLAAVNATCGPISTTQKLGAVLETRCARPTASCVRALDRLASATDELAAASKALGDQVTQATDDAACRAQFVTTPAQLTTYSDLAAAYRTLALGSEQRDADISGLGRTRIADALKQLTPSGTVDSRVARLRADCEISAAD